MWFADTGQVLARVLLVAWFLAVGLWATRRGQPRNGTALLDGPRTPLLVGTTVALVLFAAQAAVVDAVADLPAPGAPGPGVLDHAVWSWVLAHRVAWLTPLIVGVSAIGGTVSMTALVLVGVTALTITHRRAEAAVVLIAFAGSGLLEWGFKHLYERSRPPVADQLVVETTYALPSGHTLDATVVLGVLAAVVVLHARRVVLRVGAAAAAALGAVLIGLSRIYLGVHWATDVLTGWLLGGTWLAVCVTALVVLEHRGPVGVGVPPRC